MLNRRELLTIAGSSVVATAFAARAQTVLADPDPTPNPEMPPTAPRVPFVYPFQVGTIEGFSIQDGVLALPSIQPMLVPEGTPAEIAKIMAEYHLSAAKISISMNVLLLKLTDGWTLIDAGAGSAFGEAGGRLVRGLIRLGVPPSEIKRIVVTHAHGDHIGGLLTANDESLFPEAQIFISKAESDFWLAPTPDTKGIRLPEEGRIQAVATAQRVLNRVKSQLQSFSSPKITDELEVVPAPGHTPGHSCVLISSGDEQLLHLADTMHVYPLQFRHPEWTVAFDVNPALASKTRAALFQRAHREKLRLHAFHMPFPGFGHLRAAGKSYEWLPQPWDI